MPRVFELPVNEEEFLRDTRITVPRDNEGHPTAPFFTKYHLPIQVGFVDWKTRGKSFIFPVTVTEGEDEGKTAELYPGATAEGVWKLKDILDALGVSYSTNDAGNVTFDPDECENKIAVGVWSVEKGYRGGVQSPENLVKQLKLVSIVKEAPANQEQVAQELL